MPTDKEIFEGNLRREEEHRGETQRCVQCGNMGIVGDDLVAMTTLAHTNEMYFLWIHESCAAESYVGNVIEV